MWRLEVWYWATRSTSDNTHTNLICRSCGVLLSRNEVNINGNGAPLMRMLIASLKLGKIDKFAFAKLSRDINVLVENFFPISCLFRLKKRIQMRCPKSCLSLCQQLKKNSKNQLLVSVFFLNIMTLIIKFNESLLTTLDYYRVVSKL